MTDQRWCYYVCPTQDPADHGGYVPSIVEEGVAGYSPLMGRGECSAPWIWGADLETAENHCDQQNEKLGLTQKDVWEITASSMRAQNLRDHVNSNRHQ